MAAKMCTDCNTRKAQNDTPEHSMCYPCYEYAGMENEHSDNGHDDIDTYSLENTTFKTQAEVDAYIADTKEQMKVCPVCHPELDPRLAPVKKGHANGGRTGTYMSHKGHNHPRTPKAREACRRAIKGENTVDAPEEV